MYKNGFWNFVFACIPGAGQMYQEYPRRGISIMLLFSITIQLTSTFGFVLFSLLLPIEWFAAFFDTFRLARILPPYRSEKPDDWIWNLDAGVCRERPRGRSSAIGLGLMALGVWLLLERLIDLLGEIFPGLSRAVLDVLWGLLHRYLPAAVLAIALIWLGLRFIAGPADRSRTDRSADAYRTQPDDDARIAYPAEDSGSDAADADTD